MEQQGYSTTITSSKKITGQIKWQQSMRNHLEKICNFYDLTIIHPQAGSGVRHISTGEYIQQKLFDIKQELNEIEETIKNMKEFQKLLSSTKTGLFKSNDYSEIIQKIEYLLSLEKKFKKLQKSYDEEIFQKSTLKDQLRSQIQKNLSMTADYNQILEFLENNNLNFQKSSNKYVM